MEHPHKHNTLHTNNDKHDTSGHTQNYIYSLHILYDIEPSKHN